MFQPIPGSTETSGARLLDAAFEVHRKLGPGCLNRIGEFKAVEAIVPIHEAQLLTYLKLTGMRLGFVINFNVARLKDGIKRVVL
jgi:hypothetical protein